MKCDNCRTDDYPLVFSFEFFGRVWHICPRCSTRLLYVMKNFPAYLVKPKDKLEEIEPEPGSLADIIAKKGAALRAVG